MPLHRLHLLLVLLLQRARHLALVHVPQDDRLVHAATRQDVPANREACNQSFNPSIIQNEDDYIRDVWGICLRHDFLRVQRSCYIDAA